MEEGDPPALSIAIRTAQTHPLLQAWSSLASAFYVSHLEIREDPVVRLFAISARSCIWITLSSERSWGSHSEWVAILASHKYVRLRLVRLRQVFGTGICKTGWRFHIERQLGALNLGAASNRSK